MKMITKDTQEKFRKYCDARDEAFVALCRDLSKTGSTTDREAMMLAYEYTPEPKALPIELLD